MENGHSITVLEIATKNYMNNIISKKETIKNDQIVKLPWVPKLGPNLTLLFMAEGKLYSAKIFVLILKNYGRPSAWSNVLRTKFSFEGFVKISSQ